MDLCELKNSQTQRHPWETVRAKILGKILYSLIDVREINSVLDVGCGDGFIIKKLFNGLKSIEIDAVDINLDQEQINSFSIADNNTFK